MGEARGKGGAGIYLGIESEALRITGDGRLSRSPHPFPKWMEQYSMDFSQSQLEVVTAPSKGAQQAADELKRHFSYALDYLNGETLWPFSMPPELPPEEEIPIAYAAGPLEDRRKFLYRKGLAARYGKYRQMICGVHINLSAGPELLYRLLGSGADLSAADGLYLKAARGILEYLDVLILLTGASPVAAPGFPGVAPGRPAVSLRNSGAGYAGRNYMRYFDVSGPSAYWKALKVGLDTVSQEFHRIKLVSGGDVNQLSDRVFQSEKEFYAPLRLKRSTGPYGNPVPYLEARIFDRDPFVPEGVSGPVLHFMQLLFYRALTGKENAGFDLRRSMEDRGTAADLSPDDIIGRKSFTAKKLFDKGRRLIEALEPFADDFDGGLGKGVFHQSLSSMAEMLDRPDALPSVRIYREFMDADCSWSEYGAVLAATVMKGEVHELHYAGV